MVHEGRRDLRNLQRVARCALLCHQVGVCGVRHPHDRNDVDGQRDPDGRDPDVLPGARPEQRAVANLVLRPGRRASRCRRARSQASGSWRALSALHDLDLSVATAAHRRPRRAGGDGAVRRARARGLTRAPPPSRRRVVRRDGRAPRGRAARPGRPHVLRARGAVGGLAATVAGGVAVAIAMLALASFVPGRRVPGSLGAAQRTDERQERHGSEPCRRCRGGAVSGRRNKRPARLSMQCPITGIM